MSVLGTYRHSATAAPRLRRFGSGRRHAAGGRRLSRTREDAGAGLRSRRWHHRGHVLERRRAQHLPYVRVRGVRAAATRPDNGRLTNIVPQEYLCEGEVCPEVTTALYLTPEDLTSSASRANLFLRAIGLDPDPTTPNPTE